MEKIYVNKNIFELKNLKTKVALEDYLERFKKYVLENDVDLEIYEDLKDRIEEKLQEIKEKIWEIDKKSIESLIKEIWEPEEILSEEKEKKNKSFNFNMPKFEKFYKNSKRWKFLWVCYGIWKSLDIEPIWVRIFFIILLFIINIFAIILYVLLALVLPDEAENGKIELNYSWLEWAIRRFFNLLYKLGEKIISILK